MQSRLFSSRIIPSRLTSSRKGRVAIPARCRKYIIAQAQSAKPPSMRTNSTELEWIQQYSEIVPDTMQLAEDSPIQPKAVTVTFRMLDSILNSSVGQQQYENAIDKAKAYVQQVDLGTGQDIEKHREDLFLDKAEINVALLKMEDVEGQVSIEVDPRIARNRNDLIIRTQQFSMLMRNGGCPVDRCMLRIHATWAGIQAAKELQKMGINVHLISVNSFAQAVMACLADVSVIQINVGALQDTYANMPGLIKDPSGPREDSGCSSDSDPVLRLIEKIYCFIRQSNGETKIMAAGVRTAADAKALAGCDYLVLNDKVINQLSSSSTMVGYNTGLSGDDIVEGEELKLTDAWAIKQELTNTDDIDQSENAFEDQVGVAGMSLMNKLIDREVQDVDTMLNYYRNKALGSE